MGEDAVPLFDLAVPAIHDHRGHVEKFVGDGLLAVFGAPQRSEEPADEALKAALEIVDKLGDGGPLEFSVMGDAVNVASRIEGATRDTGDRILLSEDTAARLQSDYDLERRDGIELKGKSKAVCLLAPKL